MAHWGLVAAHSPNNKALSLSCRVRRETISSKTLRVIARLISRNNNAKLIAYFQSATNTYDRSTKCELYGRPLTKTLGGWPGNRHST